MRLLEKYIMRQFISIFGFCLIGATLIFLTVDIVENIDQFIDREVPGNMIFLYYLAYIPNVMVLTMPVATLLAAVFSIGTLAKHNEIVAMKALGYSMYQVNAVLMFMGLMVSLLCFFIAEGIVIRTNRYKERIQNEYIDRKAGRDIRTLRNIEIQEPPDKIITIDRYNPDTQTARNVKIHTFQQYRLVRRIDAATMVWDGQSWWIYKGVERNFEFGVEIHYPNIDSMRFDFQFNPDEILMAQVKPEQMDMRELQRFIRKVRAFGGEVHQWMTDYYLRVSFPLSNVMIVLFALPLVYNRRKKSLTIGFFICLAITFFYFGIVKLGQTIGQNGGMHPILAAWLGNSIMWAGGVINLIKTRK